MPYTFSDHLGPTALSNSINSTQTTIQLDSLPSGFVDDVDNASDPRFPVRIGGQGRASHERVIVTGVNAGSNEIVVERGAEYGAESHNAGTRIAHPFVAETADVAAAKQVALPEPWEPEDFLKGDAQVGPTVDQVLTHYPWEDAAGISKIPRFLIDVTRIEKIPNALQRNHVRSSVATRWDSNGDLVEDSAGTLRLQRDPATQAVQGLLYEPKRTQLLSAPQDLTAGDWIKSDTSVTGNVGSAKGQSYDSLTENTADASHLIEDDGPSGSDNDPFALSAIVRANGRNWIRLGVLFQDSASASAWFNLNNGVIGSDDSSSNNWTLIEHAIDDLGDGWYRCRLVGKPPASDDQWLGYFLSLANGDSVKTYTGDGSSGIYVMHTQAEVSREVTTPILQGGGVRESDEVNYGFSFPDKTTGVAYSIEQQSGGGAVSDIGPASVGLRMGTTSNGDDQRHGVLMYGRGINDRYKDGFKTGTRNSDEDDSSGDSPLDETIDRFEVRYGISQARSPVHVVRQIAIWTQTLTSAQKSDLESSYLTQP